MIGHATQTVARPTAQRMIDDDWRMPDEREDDWHMPDEWVAWQMPWPLWA